MKTLLVLRHAKSSWKHPELSDHDRPLNKRGRRDAPRVGQLLRRRGLVPDVIVSSTAVRARSTAEDVAAATDASSVILDPRLYLADPETIIDVVQGHGGEAARVLVVAHNPGCGDLVALLTERSEEFPTAALAQLELEIAAWTDLRRSTRARLVDVWRPKDEAPIAD